MSRRFARTLLSGGLVAPAGGAVSEEWAWRSVGDVALDVLRRRAVPPGTKTEAKMQ
jgi:hypothetical protein